MGRTRLTPKQLNDNVAFRASKSAAQTSGAGATTQALYNNSVYDIGGNYSTSTSQFTAPYAGIYHFSANIGLGTSATAIGIIFLYKNGAVDTRGTDYRSSSGNKGLVVSGDIQLAAGDTVDVRVYTDVAVAYDPSGPDLNNFSGHLVRAT